jgi:hypothetical protein
MDTDKIVQRSITWFLNSGIMRPADGFWGVAERIALLADNEAAAQIRRAFPSQTPLVPGVVVLENRRPDCNMQTAFLFELAAEAPGQEAIRSVADNILGYLLRRSCLRDEDPASATCGLWGWANPKNRSSYWTDDNAWLATIALLLADRGRPYLQEIGIAAARSLNRLVAAYLAELRAAGAPPRPDGAPMKGLCLNPHWLGVVTMALAHAAAADPETDYANTVAAYHDLVLPGPGKTGASPSGPGWTVSEYAYLALTASVCARQFGDEASRSVARQAADILIRRQSDQGHFPSEHDEAPRGEHVADLIYTQNWATLGLLHAGRLFGCTDCRAACLRSLEFLERTQDESPEPWLRGCWRGAYDMRTGRWGGGDRFEGGAGSIYSGWTNAPITLAFLMESTGANLFPGGCRHMRGPLR